jgi:hypothetical protein
MPNVESTCKHCGSRWYTACGHIHSLCLRCSLSVRAYAGQRHNYGEIGFRPQAEHTTYENIKDPVILKPEIPDKST